MRHASSWYSNIRSQYYNIPAHSTTISALAGVEGRGLRSQDSEPRVQDRGSRAQNFGGWGKPRGADRYPEALFNMHPTYGSVQNVKQDVDRAARYPEFLLRAKLLHLLDHRDLVAAYASSVPGCA
eukprot:3761105-Rhodomonas_salina.1